LSLVSRQVVSVLSLAEVPGEVVGEVNVLYSAVDLIAPKSF